MLKTLPLPSMACSVNPICYPCQFHRSIHVNNWLKLILKSFPGGYSSLIFGVRPYNFVNGLYKFHSLAFPVPNSSHQKRLSLYRRSVCFQLSSVQLGRRKAASKHFCLWLLYVHHGNSSYVPWFRPQAVCRALFSQGWGVLCIPSRRPHRID